MRWILFDVGLSPLSLNLVIPNLSFMVIVCANIRFSRIRYVSSGLSFWDGLVDLVDGFVDLIDGFVDLVVFPCY